MTPTPIPTEAFPQPTPHTSTPRGLPASRLRRHAIVAGVSFLVTDVTAIVAVLAYQPLLQDPGFITSDATGFPIRVGAILEVFLLVGIFGTALALYPILRKQSQGMALGYVVARALEAAAIAVGILSLLTILTLRSGFAPGDDPATYTALAKALIALHDWTFVFGPHVILSLHATILGGLLVSSRLVPRWIGMVALIDGPILFVSSIAMLSGAYTPTSPIAIGLALPMLAFEVALAAWLIAKGFRQPAVAALAARSG